MAHIRKRGKTYFVEVCIDGDKRRATFPTKGIASQWAISTQAEIITSKQRFGGIPNITFGKLLERYRDQVSVIKAGEKWERVRINQLLRDPISLIMLPKLNETHVAEWRDRRLKSVSNASVRREWNLLSAACSIAMKEWKWLSFHPMKNVRRPAAPQARDRRVTDDELAALIFVLGYESDVPPKTQTARVGAAFLFAIETAMRMGEITGLVWERVDIKNQIAHLEQTKNGTRRHVPLSTEAIKILENLRSINKSGSVFAINSANLDSLFRKAKAKAMIEDLHFHDTRHEAITRLAQNPKLTVLDIARIVGHKNLNQLQTYYNPTAGELAKKLG